MDPHGADIVVKGSDEFRSKYYDIRSWLKENHCDHLITEFENDKSVIISIIEGNETKIIRRGHRSNNLSSATISFNPNAFAMVDGGNTRLSPSVTLMHEVKHLYDEKTDRNKFLAERELQFGQYDNVAEYNAIQFETQIARSLGEISIEQVTRTKHSGYYCPILEKCSAEQMSKNASRFNQSLKLPKLYTDIRIILQ